MAQTRQDYFRYPQDPTHATHSQTIFPEKGPSSSQVLILAILLPLGAFLLFLAAITLTGTVIGVAVTTPLFVIFSPVLVPAALLIGLAVTGFLTSGAFGVTALSSFTWLANYLSHSRLPEQLEHAKHRAQETISQAAQSVKEAREGVLSKAQESGQEIRNERQESRQKAQESGQEAQDKSQDSRQKGQSGKAQEDKSSS